MIAQVTVKEKAFGDNELMHDLGLTFQAGEKVGLIGTNGCGKSTLLKIMAGLDNDYEGEVKLSRNISVISTEQEHADTGEVNVTDYIKQGLPEYARLWHIIETYPHHMGDNAKKLHEYGDALDRFAALGYYDVEQQLESLLAAYELTPELASRPLNTLSGGQKRFVELIKVQLSRADLLLMDEPTNHMDYVAKAAFISWLQQSQAAVVIVTHDRDVLGVVDKIIEIRDQQAFEYPGNYDAYLKIHTNRITSEVNEHQVHGRRSDNLESDITNFQRLKEKARNPKTIKRFKKLEQDARVELEVMKGKSTPTFWIDKESKAKLAPKVADAYEDHKSRTININTAGADTKSSAKLLELTNVELGYEQALFPPITRQLYKGDILQLHGRNGAGKTTLVQAIINHWAHKPITPPIYNGTIWTDKSLRIGVYEQEVNPDLLGIKLGEAIEAAYAAQELTITDQKIRQLLSQYLFKPQRDLHAPVATLSGGQKARLQIISMLATNPNLLILDEPTNHLDLPSIEELESALQTYKGAVIYISHDEYFARAIGGEQLIIAPQNE